MPVSYEEAVHPSLLTDDELIAQSLAMRAQLDRMALKDPLSLARHLDPRTVSRAHLRIASQEIAKLEPGGGGRLMIVMPPQVGKSRLAATWTPFHWLCKYPTTRGIIGSYAASLAHERGRDVRNLVTQYGHRYGLSLDRSSKAKNNWMLETGGGIKSAGVGGGITGSPANLGIIDDPFKDRAEADSPVIRNKVWDWYSGAFYSRLSPGAPIIIMQTRWHEDDLIGRLLKEQGEIGDGGVWKLVYLPAIAMEPNAELHIPEDALGRAPGDPLTHPLIAPGDVDGALKHWMDKKNSSTPRDWAALYQGSPRPTDGSLVTRELLRQRRHYTTFVTPTKRQVAVDPSGGGRSVAGIIGGWLGEDGKLYLSADRSGVMSSELWSEAACMLAAEMDADVIWVEHNYGGDMHRVVPQAWDDLRRRAAGYRDRHPAARAAEVEAVLVTLGATREHGPDLAMSPKLSPILLHSALMAANEPLPDETSAIEGNSERAVKIRQRALRRLAVLLETYGITTMAPEVLAGEIAAARYLSRLTPAVKPSSARVGKRLRAEVVAQQFTSDNLRFAVPMPECEEEWATWSDESKYSPGRIDASVHLALRMLPIPGADALVSTPTNVSRSQAESSGAAGMPIIPRTQGYRPLGGFGGPTGR